MTRYRNLDDAKSLRDRCDARESDLFNTRDELEILRLSHGRDGTGDEKDVFWVARREGAINIKQLQDLSSVWILGILFPAYANFIRIQRMKYKSFSSGKIGPGPPLTSHGRYLRLFWAGFKFFSLSGDVLSHLGENSRKTISNFRLSISVGAQKRFSVSKDIPWDWRGH